MTPSALHITPLDARKSCMASYTCLTAARAFVFTMNETKRRGGPAGVPAPAPPTAAARCRGTTARLRSAAKDQPTAHLEVSPWKKCVLRTTGTLSSCRYLRISFSVDFFPSMLVYQWTCSLSSMLSSTMAFTNTSSPPLHTISWSVPPWAVSGLRPASCMLLKKGGLHMQKWNRGWAPLGSAAMALSSIPLGAGRPGIVPATFLT
mmetsp:Transcript_7908/g.22641  ORF Transcript_7908/g.22641 Transcript_7908/m.22641 type:complete len:205 (+) Transcript_7908:473-1087(+)